MGHTFNRPDEAAMLRILERHPHSPEGAILRLAWLEGLSRSEITELRWDQVDFEGKAIQLPDRTVPLEPSTEACLRERHVRCALRDPHVVISERSKKPMPPESISRLSRLALDSEGQKVNLMDLRHDFVIRQLQTHDWPYVARVSGMAVSTLRDAFSPYLTKPAAPENPLAQRDEAEYLLWRVIQQEGSSPAGLALWMGWKLQMQPGEIASLTWGRWISTRTSSAFRTGRSPWAAVCGGCCWTLGTAARTPRSRGSLPHPPPGGPWTSPG